MILLNATINSEDSDNVFVDGEEITAIQVDNLDNLLRKIIDRDSIDRHESVDSWLGDDHETLEDEDDFWTFDPTFR